MLIKASKLVKKFFFPLLIIFVAGLLAMANYEPGTILTGWDSLHPEFNFLLAFKRAFFGTWREDQGLGAIAMHSHMADLPRIALLWLSSFFLKISDIRYFYVFLTLILGPLGIYYFLSFFLKSRLAAFLGAVFYLLNLTTLQHFFVPFEMFLTQYAFLPWLFWSFVKVMESGKKGDFLALFVLSLFAAPMAYAATLFYAYLGALIIFVVTYILFSKDKLQKIKRAAILIAIVFATNAFWMLPNIYAIKNNSEAVTNSRINTLFSPEAFIRNKDYGDIEDISLQTSYLFSWRAYDFKNREFVDLMKVWKDHLDDKLVVYVGYLFSVIAFIGLLVSILKRKRVAVSLFFVLIYSLFFLINANPPAGEIYTYFYKNFPVFSEGFRMPFSKFSIIYIFSLSFFFAFSYQFIFDLFKNKIFPILMGIGTLILLFYFMQPAFKGNLISDVVKTSIPKEYEYAFNYLDEKGGRVAKLPIYTPFNWEYHYWGYEGSAWFSWFSMKNPQLDRDFDRFSKFNETFYTEASFALYNQDLTSFEKVLEKYNVSYLLLDESIVNAGGSKDLLYTDNLKEKLSVSDSIKVEQKYDFLTIYKTNYAKDEPVFAPQAYEEVDADLTFARVDPIYEEKGRYVVDGEGVTYPFVNFETRQRPTLSFNGREIVFETKPLNFSSVKYLAVGDLKSDLFGEESVRVSEKRGLEASVFVNQVIKEDFSQKRGFDGPKNCDIKKIGSVYKENKGDEIVYKAEEGGVSCDFFVFDGLSYNQGYILHIVGENRQGRGLKIYLQNRTTARMDLEELLPQGRFNEYFFILPKDIKGEGYTLNLETRSFGDVASENVLERVEFIPFPYEWLANIKLVPKNYGIKENKSVILAQERINPTRYEVKAQGGGLIVLDQAYEDGWQAFVVDEVAFPNIAPFLGRRLVHTKVNSWANGWVVSEGGQDIVILYLPQYLEYIGLIMLVVVFVAFIRRKASKTFWSNDYPL